MLLSWLSTAAPVADFLTLAATMQQEFPYKHYDPNRLLDTLQERLGVRNAQALAEHLQICGKTLDKIRNGNLQLSTTLLVCMAECAGTNMEEL